VPHDVVPEGQQQLVAGSEHAPLQHLVPHIDDPAAHAHLPVLRSAHAVPAEQQEDPQGVAPGGHPHLLVAASAQKASSPLQQVDPHFASVL
jgi:hypothetical protein